MNSDSEEVQSNTKYLIFEVLSHPARVKILSLIEESDLTFSSLKRELGMESSGQLQHHLQKMSNFVTEKQNGCYGLTDLGRQALYVYRESEKSGRSLEDICCIPAPSATARSKQVGREGTLLRLFIGVALLVLTVAILASYFVTRQTGLNVLQFNGSSVSFGLAGSPIFGFFGASFLIAAVTGFPGCEITAIPNLLSGKKRYCGCFITPFNLPNGRFLRRNLKRK